MFDGSNNGAGGPGGLPPGSSPFNRPTPEGAGKKVSEVLGEITWLMSQSPIHKRFFISDLEWFVMTPVLLQQFRLFYDETKPIGVIFWAHASPEVAEMLAAGTSKLRPQDWKSGDELWVVEAVTPFGGAEVMIKDLKEKVFATRTMRFVAIGTGGAKEVRVI